MAAFTYTPDSTFYHFPTYSVVTSVSITAPTLPLPLLKKKDITLDSAVIVKSTLQPVEVVVEMLKTVRSAGELAVRLARECIFGEDVLANYTV